MHRLVVQRCVKRRRSVLMQQIGVVIRPVADVNVWSRAARNVAIRRFVRHVRTAAARPVSENGSSAMAKADREDTAAGRETVLQKEAGILEYVESRPLCMS
mgnify:CR=1 FL=1